MRSFIGYLRDEKHKMIFLWRNSSKWTAILFSPYAEFWPQLTVSFVSRELPIMLPQPISFREEWTWCIHVDGRKISCSLYLWPLFSSSKKGFYESFLVKGKSERSGLIHKSEYDGLISMLLFECYHQRTIHHIHWEILESYVQKGDDL